MCVLVWYVDCRIVFVLFNGMWAVEWYVGCFKVWGCCLLYGMLNGMLAVVGYVGCCMACGLQNMWAVNGMCAVVVYVGSCIVCGLLYYIWAAG